MARSCASFEFRGHDERASARTISPSASTTITPVTRTWRALTLNPPVSVHAYRHVLGGRGQERRLQVAHAIGPDQHALGRRGYARAVDHRADRVRVASERAPHGERDVSLRTRYVPSNELKWQRTVAVIMRLTSKATPECAGSAFQVAIRHLHEALFGAELGRGIANTAVRAAVESPL